MSYLVTKRFSLSSEDGNQHYCIATIYNIDTNSYSNTTLAINDAPVLYLGDGQELVFDFENKKVYLDEEEISIYDGEGNEFTDFEHITGLYFT